MISDDLQAVRAKILGELSRKPECFVVHPREVRVLQQLSADELKDFARAQSWSVVRRLGGQQYQFYNDTYGRAQA